MGLTVSHKIKWKERTREVRLSPMKAIRFKCLDCTNWQPKEVKLCKVPDCPLFPYRLYGTDSWRRREGQADTGTERAVLHDLPPS